MFKVIQRLHIIKPTLIHECFHIFGWRITIKHGTVAIAMTIHEIVKIEPIMMSDPYIRHWGLKLLAYFNVCAGRVMKMWTITIFSVQKLSKCPVLWVFGCLWPVNSTNFNSQFWAKIHIFGLFQFFCKMHMSYVWCDQKSVVTTADAMALSVVVLFIIQQVKKCQKFHDFLQHFL